ncbi:MAG: DUF2752 domain-containing protein [Blastocatellia bacterium]|nr:DUF2752 domain-containing protein [Blastocatellia bacterium]
MTILDRLRARMGPAELGWFVFLTAILVASVVWHPYDEGGFIVCAVRRATGLPCPGCGLTRSFCAMAKGELTRAGQFHALGPAMFTFASVYWLRSIALLAGWKDAVARYDAGMMRWKVPHVFGAVFLLAWFVKIGVMAWTGELSRLAAKGALAHLF